MPPSYYSHEKNCVCINNLRSMTQPFQAKCHRALALRQFWARYFFVARDGEQAGEKPEIQLCYLHGIRLSSMPFVSFRLLLFVVVLLSSQVLQAGQADNYPFSIDNEKTPNGHRIVARNAGPSPVSVRLSLVDAQFVSTDRQFPVYVVVPPGGGTLYLGEIRSAMPGVGYTFRTQYTWTLGDFNAVQAPDALYRLPYPDGTSFIMSQAPDGPITTHNRPDSQYAVDITTPEGTPVLAARDGTVIFTEANQVYGAQRPDLMDKANEVRIQHIDGTFAVYAHLKHGGVFVYPGQRVRAGQQIGLSGSTGYSSGPHLHFAVQTLRKAYDKIDTISLPFRFYVGNPAVAFVPQLNLVAKAHYSGPVTSPDYVQPTLTAQAPARTLSDDRMNTSYAYPARAAEGNQPPPSPHMPASAAGVKLVVDPVVMGWIQNIKAKAEGLTGYTWFAMAVLIILYLMRKSRRAYEKRRFAHRLVREPSLRDWSDR